MKNLSKDIQNTILAIATDLNFWGKRLRTVKLGLCDSILKDLEIPQAEMESGTLCDWLIERKPVKEAAAKKVKAEKVAVEPVFAGSMTDLDHLIKTLNDGSYIITAVQNNTAPHPCFATLKTLANAIGASLLAMPIHYVRQLDKEQREAINYHKDVKPYLLDKDVFLGDKKAVRVAVSANIVPTAKQAVRNAEALNNGEAVTIVASPRCQSASLGRSKTANERYAMTSRVSTVRHYQDCRAGSEAAKDHWFGGVLLTVERGEVYITPLESDEKGEIIYNGQAYMGDRCTDTPVQPVIVLGDLHLEKSDEQVWSDTCNMLYANEPSLIVCHDTMDFSSRNHHNRNSGQFLYQQKGVTVLSEMTIIVNKLNELASIAPLYIVASNHDEALNRWLDCPFYKADQDPINAKTYYFLKLAVLEMLDGDDDLEVLELALAELAESGKLPPLADNIEFGNVDTAKVVNGHDVSMHGHIGQGGARGSLPTFKRFGMPNVTGHSHTGRRDGIALVVGVTGSYEMGYNKGMTTWSRDNAFLYPNGTAALMPLYGIKF